MKQFYTYFCAANSKPCGIAIILIRILLMEKTNPSKKFQGSSWASTEGKSSQLPFLKQSPATTRKVGFLIFPPLYSHTWSAQWSRILNRQISQEVREIPKHYLWKILDTKSIGIVLKSELWRQGVRQQHSCIWGLVSPCWQLRLNACRFTLRHSGAGGGDVTRCHHLQHSLRRLRIPLSPVLCSSTSSLNEQLCVWEKNSLI